MAGANHIAAQLPAQKLRIPALYPLRHGIAHMHALFALEDQYGLHAYRDESGVPQLMFKDKGHDSLNMLDHIGTWADMYQKFRNEEITEKEYLDWKSQFPAK